MDPIIINKTIGLIYTLNTLVRLSNEGIYSINSSQIESQLVTNVSEYLIKEYGEHFVINNRAINEGYIDALRIFGLKNN